MNKRIRKKKEKQLQRQWQQHIGTSKRREAMRVSRFQRRVNAAINWCCIDTYWVPPDLWMYPGNEQETTALTIEQKGNSQ